MTIKSVECWVLRAPIQTPVKAAFGSMADRPAVFVRIAAADGAWGWGEVFCNFPQVGAEHRARLIDSLLGPIIMGERSDSPSILRGLLESKTRRMALQAGEPGPFAQIIAAFDQAMWDMAGRRAGLPLWNLLSNGRPNGGKARVYASGLGPEGVVETALRKQAEGFRAFKFKVGFDSRGDLENFQQIRCALGPETPIMVDANQGWAPAQAARRIAEMREFNPYWIEEPIAADEPLSTWQTLALECSLPLAAGENIRGEAQFDATLRSGHLAFIQPDVAKWGGISGCMAVAQSAGNAGAIFCPHWLGGGIGLAASLHLRSALGDDGFVEVDSNPNPLREEIFPPLQIDDGWLTLSANPGIGVEPDLLRMRPYIVAH